MIHDTQLSLYLDEVVKGDEKIIEITQFAKEFREKLELRKNIIFRIKVSTHGGSSVFRFSKRKTTKSSTERTTRSPSESWLV